MFKTVDAIVLGDPHLSGETTWQLKVSQHIIEWTAQLELIGSETDVLVLGDVTDKYLANPITHDLVAHFISTLARRARTVHILVGNHDISKKDEVSLAAQEQYVSYAYLKRFLPNVHIYEKPCEFTLADLRCVAIPYYYTPRHSLIDLSDFSEGRRPLRDYGIDDSAEFDFVAAHHFLRKGANNIRIPVEVSVDVDKLFLTPPKKIVSGHVHTLHANPEQYTGSLYPLKSSEQGVRVYWTYTHNEGWSYHQLTPFCELLSVEFGQPLPEPSEPTAIPVYTITNCSSKAQARHKYPNALVRKTVSTWDSIRKDSKLTTATVGQSAAGLNKRDILKSFRKDMLTSEAVNTFDASQEVLDASFELIYNAIAENEEGSNARIE